MSAYLQPTINCPQCGKLVFPYVRNDVYRAECVDCAWRTIHVLDMKKSELVTAPKVKTAAQRFAALVDSIERQGKSGELLRILGPAFEEVLAELEKADCSQERLLMTGCGTLAALAVLKHI